MIWRASVSRGSNRQAKNRRAFRVGTATSPWQLFGTVIYQSLQVRFGGSSPPFACQFQSGTVSGGPVSVTRLEVHCLQSQFIRDTSTRCPQFRQNTG